MRLYLAADIVQTGVSLDVRILVFIGQFQSDIDQKILDDVRRSSPELTSLIRANDEVFLPSDGIRDMGELRVIIQWKILVFFTVDILVKRHLHMTSGNLYFVTPVRLDEVILTTQINDDFHIVSIAFDTIVNILVKRIDFPADVPYGLIGQDNIFSGIQKLPNVVIEVLPHLRVFVILSLIQVLTVDEGVSVSLRNRIVACEVIFFFEKRVGKSMRIEDALILGDGQKSLYGGCPCFRCADMQI